MTPSLSALTLTVPLVLSAPWTPLPTGECSLGLPAKRQLGWVWMRFQGECRGNAGGGGGPAEGRAGLRLGNSSGLTSAGGIRRMGRCPHKAWPLGVACPRREWRLFGGLSSRAGHGWQGLSVLQRDLSAQVLTDLGDTLRKSRPVCALQMTGFQPLPSQAFGMGPSPQKFTPRVHAVAGTAGSQWVRGLGCG